MIRIAIAALALATTTTTAPVPAPTGTLSIGHDPGAVCVIWWHSQPPKRHGHHYRQSCIFTHGGKVTAR